MTPTTGYAPQRMSPELPGLLAMITPTSLAQAAFGFPREHALGDPDAPVYSEEQNALLNTWFDPLMQRGHSAGAHWLLAAGPPLGAIALR